MNTTEITEYLIELCTTLTERLGIIDTQLAELQSDIKKQAFLHTSLAARMDSAKPAIKSMIKRK